MKIYLQSRNRLMDIENRFLVAKGVGIGDWKVGDSNANYYMKDG